MEKVQNFLGLRAEFSPEIMQLRGAITKKKRENLGKIPKVGGGGGLKKADENSQYQFGNLEDLGRGQCPQLKKQTRISKKQTNTGPCLREIIDQYRTYIISIPDLIETNNRPIPDLTMLMFL